MKNPQPPNEITMMSVGALVAFIKEDPDQLNLMACTDNQTGQQVFVLTIIKETPKGRQIIPLARLFSGPPFEEVTPYRGDAFNPYQLRRAS